MKNGGMAGRMDPHSTSVLRGRPTGCTVDSSPNFATIRCCHRGSRRCGRSLTEPRRRPKVSRANRETFGRTFRRGRETRAEPRAALLWPVSDRATPPTEGLPANRETFGQTFRRGRETRAEPRPSVKRWVAEGRTLCCARVNKITLPTEGLPRNRETFGQTFRRGRETRAEPRAALLWPVSDRATPPTEGLPANRETFGRTFRRGRETRAEPGVGRPAPNLGPPYC